MIWRGLSGSGIQVFQAQLIHPDLHTPGAFAPGDVKNIGSGQQMNGYAAEESRGLPGAYAEADFGK